LTIQPNVQAVSSKRPENTARYDDDDDDDDDDNADPSGQAV
jgi:hypothetical protein